MGFFQTITEKILLIFAQLLKIQSNWFYEVISVLLCIGIIIGLGWTYLKISKMAKFVPDTEKKFKKYGLKILPYINIFVGVGMIVGTLVHIILVIYIAKSPEFKLSDFSLKDEEIQQEFLNVNIYDKQGNKVYTVINDGVNRETVSLNEIPKQLETAFVNVEDKDFYKHSGFSTQGYLRAIFYKITNPSAPMHGGSTLTQQLIKNAKGHINNRTVLHKYQEALLAIIIENKYDKKEILEMYLNRIYLGKGNIYGVGTASKHYFNKHVSDLTLSEIAFLAGLPQAPSQYTENLELGNKRKNTVLGVMKENGSITENQWKKASQETVFLASLETIKPSSLDAYVDYVLKEAKEVYNISEEELKHKGFNIYTYLDTNLQNHMYQSVQSFKFKDDNAANGNLVQVGIAAVDSNSGKLISLYGGRNYLRGYKNRAYERFQPGSILKPLVAYGPAFETKKWNPFSKVIDEKKDFGAYSPNNFGQIYEGSITIERALLRSANIPAVSVLEDIGVETGTATLEKMGIPIEEKDKQLHIALGGMEKGVTPIEMAQSYAMFSNFGYYEPARAIKFIKDAKGEFILEENAENQGKDIFSPENAYYMTELLKKVITDPNGTGKNANIGRPVAGKTGTAEEKGTTGNRAAWFVGYTPEISMAVHLGFDQPSQIRYLTTSGGDEPAKLFAEIMKKTLVNVPVKDFQKPPEAISLSAGPTLQKVENLDVEYDSTNKQIALKWEDLNSSGGIVYKIYKKGKDREDIEIGTTTETFYYDRELPIKTKTQEIPNYIGWEDKSLLYLQKAFTTTTNLIGEKRSYYVVATYQDKIAEPSEKASVYVPKVEPTE